MKIFKNAVNAKPAPGEKPKVIFLGGRGGSGKSKFDVPDEKNPGNIGIYDSSKYIVLDADKIKEQLPEYKGYNAYEVHEESSAILNQALAMARAKGLNVVLDATMKTLSSTETKVKSFDDAGYNIEMYYMHLPREKAAIRAMGRYATKEQNYKGRYVPLTELLKMKDNEANFDKLKHYATKWAFYNNDVAHKEDKPILIDKNY
ncbi:MAG: zeta toxin family protein [Alphaproteobacteria bacterium]|nr:zeta toxin family protein [Alphaproteobacteria bacterium]MBQ3946357.1 zeta toxin family protein [Alphaproteobacteria bacterium]